MMDRQSFFVIQELVAREIRRKYSRSKLGIIWSVLNPLLSMAVLSLIFSTMFRKSIENYPVYYLTGFLIWNFFTTATNTAMTALADNQMLILQVKLPRSVFPLARVCTAFVNYLYSLIAYLCILLFGRKKRGSERILRRDRDTHHKDARCQFALFRFRGTPLPYDRQRVVDV